MTVDNSASARTAQVSEALKAAAANIRRSAQEPLGIYLNDHLAGADRRAGPWPAGSPALARSRRSCELQQFVTEVAEDRGRLDGASWARWGIPVRGYKVWTCWACEKAGLLSSTGT